MRVRDGKGRWIALFLFFWAAPPLLSAPKRDNPPADNPKAGKDDKKKAQEERRKGQEEKKKDRGKKGGDDAPADAPGGGDEPAPDASPPDVPEGPVYGGPWGAGGEAAPDVPEEGGGGEEGASEAPSLEEGVAEEGVVDRALPKAEEGGPIVQMPASSGDLVLTIDMKNAAPLDHEAIGIPQTVRWSPNGRWIAVGGHYKVVRIFEAATGKWVDSRPKPHIPIFWHLGVAWSPDSRLLASAGGDHVVWVWDSTRGFNCDRGCRPVEIWTEDLYFSPDGRYLANAGKDGRLNIWDMRQPTSGAVWGRVGDRNCAPPIRSVQEPKGKDNHSVSMHSVAWSPDGKYLATGSPWGLKIWDAVRSEGAGGKTPRTGGKGWGAVKGIPLVKHIQDIQLAYDLDFTKDNKYLVAGEGPVQGKSPKGGSWRVRVYNTGSWTLARSWAAHSGRVHALECSPDGKYVLTGGNREACIWEVETGKNVKTFKGFGDEVSGVTWSPDGQYIAVVAGGEKIDKREAGPDTLVRVFKTGLGAGGKPVLVASKAVDPEFDYDKPYDEGQPEKKPPPSKGSAKPPPASVSDPPKLAENPPDENPEAPIDGPRGMEPPGSGKVETPKPSEAANPPPAPPKASGPAALFAEAEGLEKQSKWAEARDTYDQITRLFPGSPETKQAADAIARLWKDHGGELLKGMMK